MRGLHASATAMRRKSYLSTTLVVCMLVMRTQGAWTEAPAAPLTEAPTSTTAALHSGLTTPAVVSLRSSPTVSSQDILLGMIADIQTNDENLRAKLAGLYVGRAALAGSERILFTGSVRVRLRQAGIPETLVQLVAPSDRIVVRTVGTGVPNSELMQVAEKAVIQALAAQVAPGSVASGSARALAATVAPDSVSITCPALPQEVPLSSHAPYDVRLAGAVLVADLSHHITVPLAIWSEGRLQQQVTARCSVVAQGDIAVLARKMDRFETLADDDIRWEKRNVVAAPSGAIIRGVEPNPVGWRLIRPQEPGVVLTRDMVEPQPDARTEAEVDLVSYIGTVTVIDQGRLMKDARLGERVAVRNVRTGSVVYGVLATPNQVKVEATR